MNVRNYGQLLSVTEETISDLAGSFERPPPYPNTHMDDETRPERQEKGDHTPGFFGDIKNTKQVVAMFEDGWPAGANRLGVLRAKIAGLIPPPQSRRRRPTWSDDGDTLDVDRALAGRWNEAYRVATRRLTRGLATIEIVGSYGGSCARSSDEMFWSGAQMLVLSELLEDAGYSVRLVAAALTYYRYGMGSESPISLNKIIVKDYGESMRVDALAGAVCHCATYRTVGFRSKLKAPWKIDQGFGYHTTFLEFGESLRKHDEYPSGVILPDAYNEATAIANIKDAIAALDGTEPVTEAA